jgi:hypothetical protein
MRKINSRLLRNLKNFVYLCLLCGVLSLFSCTITEKAGRVLDGSAFAEKNISVYRASIKEGAAADIELREVQNKSGERSIIIMLDKFPAMMLRGSSPDYSGDFHLTSLDYIGGNVHGWNEYRLDLAGSGTLRLTDTSAALAIPGDIEPVQISSGRIHRYDTRITGNEAHTLLRNRRERILSLCDWMAGRQEAETNSIREFENLWKPILFPEMVSGKKRPVNWSNEGDQWIKAEDIRWNTGYTERVFPEELWSVRNSGTLLRDWEEALSWIYMEYNWEMIKDLLSKEVILKKIK